MFLRKRTQAQTPKQTYQVLLLGDTERVTYTGKHSGRYFTPPLFFQKWLHVQLYCMYVFNERIQSFAGFSWVLSMPGRAAATLRNN